MVTSEKVLKALDIQIKEEGETENIRLVKKVLSHCKTANEFMNFVRVDFKRYGQASYQAHKFYYIKEHLKGLVV
ncbi:MAG: hypothetical protein HRU18_01150 [Pseudoalteromonas sp.]|uniref:hypothetical protein n=1 Tax=Pseudoalteromonas sp. TaxID=53249 RepID=UPI001D66A7C2|nr:hypothetical protein [Pseudoalteromonas sp.]NRA76786.1 hypothetical protein [Pseudoalteromonas sp.]